MTVFFGFYEINIILLEWIECIISPWLPGFSFSCLLVLLGRGTYTHTEAQISFISICTSIFELHSLQSIFKRELN